MVCEECGTEMEVHYGEYCPACYKCEERTLEYFDLFKVLSHMVTKYPGIDDRIWKKVSDEVYNDTCCLIFLDSKNPDMVLLAETIKQPVEESVFFMVSW